MFTPDHFSPHLLGCMKPMCLRSRRSAWDAAISSFVHKNETKSSHPISLLIGGSILRRRRLRRIMLAHLLREGRTLRKRARDCKIARGMAGGSPPDPADALSRATHGATHRAWRAPGKLLLGGRKAPGSRCVRWLVHSKSSNRPSLRFINRYWLSADPVTIKRICGPVPVASEALTSDLIALALYLPHSSPDRRKVVGTPTALHVFLPV